ncbi:MAG: CDP-glycerol glycerophosphotransferase family protein, partial [Clostridia bacterium]|nr:CDP-glycerol glycerophosphotransferase family protein [Clostridia bacterium]
KTTGRLYFEVYKSFEFYKFGRWIHHGDNYLADKKMPSKLGIESVIHTPPKFSDYENALVSTIKKYDAYLVAAKMARFNAQNHNQKDYFCYSYASLTFVPYVVWAVKDAVEKGIDTLYFISRDGHHLKRIADKVIEKLGVNIKTKYIYGSRKVWRIPSFIDEFDESFFLPFGNVESATNFKKLLQALCLDKKTFLKIFPNLSYLKDKKSFSKKLRKTIISVLSASDEYKKYLLNFAKEKRQIIDEYFLQEMNFDEKFAFVEYWGRGYTQTCHTRLLQNVANKKCDVPYYYMRSIYPTIGSDIRYNYTDCNASLIFVEALFANIDYKSIEEYTHDENGLVIPVKQKADCDKELFEAMNKRLLEFTDDFLTESFADIDYLGRALLKFSLEYFRDNPTDEVLLQTIAPLIDAVGLFGEKREFAPKLTKEIVEKLVEKELNPIDVTSSIPMSLARSDEEIQAYYHYLTVEKPAEEKEIKKGKKTKYSAKAVDFNNKLRMLGFKSIKQSNMRIYKQFLKQNVTDSAVFFGENPEVNENYISLIKALKEQDFKISYLPFKDIYDADELQQIAKAKFIFTDDSNEFFALMKFRKQTKVVKLYNETFPIDRFGVQDIQYGKKSDLKLKSTIFNSNCSVLPIASEELFDRFNSSFNNAKNVLKPLGNPACDLYFDDEFIKTAKQKIKKINKDDKKIIVYLPCNYKSKKSTFDFVDLSVLKNYFANDYILLVKTDDKTLLDSYKTDDEFVFALDENISAREAIVASDVIIGDYSSIILESTLAQKPIVLTGVYTCE